MIYYRHGDYHSGDMSLSPFAPALRFGAGFFETVLHNGRETCHLQHHIARLQGSLNAYALPFEDIDFTTVVHEVLHRNDLLENTARVNLTYLIEDMAAPARAVVTAAPYSPQPEKCYSLAVSDLRHTSHLGAHKSNNYLHYTLARRQALQDGFDDALLLDFDDNILETSTAALLFSRRGRLLTPGSAFILPSVSLALIQGRFDVQPAQIPSTQTAEFDSAYVLNSLMGARPVVRIGERRFEADEPLCAKLNAILLRDSP